MKYNHSILGRLVNAIIRGLNDESDTKLPTYVIFVLDKDLLNALDFCDFGLNRMLKGAIQWYVDQINKLFETRWIDLRKVCLGAVNSTTKPKFLWIKMLERPGFCQTFGKNILSLGWKFNNILSETLKNEQNSEIISISIDKSDYAISGDLTSSGHYNFWKQLLDCFKAIDMSEGTEQHHDSIWHSRTQASHSRSAETLNNRHHNDMQHHCRHERHEEGHRRHEGDRTHNHDRYPHHRFTHGQDSYDCRHFNKHRRY